MKSRISLLWLLWGILLLAVAGPAWGDVTVESTFKFGGIKGMGESQGTSTQRYQGDKKWESQTTRFTGAILSRLVGEGGSITITRVDKGVSWALDVKNHTYQESPLVPPKIKSEEREPKESKEKKPTARITKSEFTVKKTGATETINGFPCEEYLITWLLEIEDLETKEKSRSTMLTDLWTTPETPQIRKVREGEMVFNKALAKKMGMELSPDEAKKMGLTVLGGMMKAPEDEMQKGLVKVKDEMSKIQGYPIRTTINWNLEGGKGPGKSQDETAQGAKSSERSEGIGGLLGGLMGKLVQKKADDKGPAPDGKGAPFFSTTFEVKTMNIEPVPAETFEVPAGYVKK
jgi:hypothetical protein